MPRPEKPIDPDDRSAHADFARTLRALRAAAGHPPYRELAVRTHFGVSTLSQAASVAARPPTREVVRALVGALGGTWEGDWERRYRLAFATPAPAPATSTPSAPEPSGSEPAVSGPSAPEPADVSGPAIVLTPAPSPGAIRVRIPAGPSASAVAVDPSPPGVDVPSPAPASVGAVLRWLRPALLTVVAVVTATVTFGAGAWHFGWFVTSSADGLSRVRAGAGERAAMRTCAERACPAVAEWSAGTAVEMLCWTDGERTSYLYPSNCWFDVREPRSGLQGYVHSSQVVAQVQVVGC